MQDGDALTNTLRQLGYELQEQDYDHQYRLLVEKINELLSQNFEKLVSILYRADVSENKLRYLLKENPAADAADIIARLLIERQLQKIESRKKFSAGDNIPEEDKW